MTRTIVSKKVSESMLTSVYILCLKVCVCVCLCACVYACVRPSGDALYIRAQAWVYVRICVRRCVHYIMLFYIMLYYVISFYLTLYYFITYIAIYCIIFTLPRSIWALCHKP